MATHPCPVRSAQSPRRVDIGISADDFKTVFEGLTKRGAPAGLTVAQIMDKTGRRKEIVLTWLRKLRNEGRLGVGMSEGFDIRGRSYPLPVYWIKAAK